MSEPYSPGTAALDASKLVNGGKQIEHGVPRRSFEMIAQLWSEYLSVRVTPVDVAQMMVLLKVSRYKCGTPLFDHFVDICGYGSLAGYLAHYEIARGENEQKTQAGD